MPALTGVVVVGHGLIGAALERRLRARDVRVTTFARSARDLPDHRAVDLADPRGHAALRDALTRQRPRSVVLTHGPSDVTWCEAHPRQARDLHAGVAATVAATGVPAVLVSTDNVFDGSEPQRTVTEPPAPANAYGRAKRAAEEAVSKVPGSAVVRTSLVYGWSGAAHRDNFAERCLEAARSGLPFAAPHDQWFTPVFVDDVADLLAAVALDPAAAPALSHLAGEEHLSRHAFARLAYRVCGADPDLVEPVERSGTTWASRPENSSLRASDFPGLPGLSGFRPRCVADALATMVARWPAGRAVRGEVRA